MSENNLKQQKIRQKYSPQFKDQAVERAAKDGVPQVAKDLGISEPCSHDYQKMLKHYGLKCGMSRKGNC